MRSCSCLLRRMAPLAFLAVASALIVSPSHSVGKRTVALPRSPLLSPAVLPSLNVHRRAGELRMQEVPFWENGALARPNRDREACSLPCRSAS